MNVNLFSVILLLLSFNIGLAQNDNHIDKESNNKISNATFDLKYPRDNNAHKEF